MRPLLTVILFCFSTQAFAQVLPLFRKDCPTCPQVCKTCPTVVKTTVSTAFPVENVVETIFQSGDSELSSHGTGILIDGETVVTALHVVHDDRGFIRFRGKRVPCEVVAVNVRHDWALLRLLEKQEVQPVKLSENPPDLASVVVSFGYGSVANNGSRSLRRFQSHVVEHGLVGDGPVSGDSGGPIFSSTGELVGVISCNVGGSRPHWRGYGLGRLRDFVNGKGRGLLHR